MRTSGRRYAGAHTEARGRLRRFRQGTLVAVAITALLLIVMRVPVSPAQDVAPGADTVTGGVEEPPDPGESLEEAAGTLRQLAVDLADLLPKLLIAIASLVAAAVLVRLARALLRRLLGQWEKAEAASAITAVAIWLLAVGVALSVIAGDARALLGSVGLLGLALSWALQAPIESFAGWLLNSFKGYYRVGDRIAVGEVFGDVYRIDSLTTTVWEAGGPEKPVQGAQPTGALVTFPNSEVLRANIINFTRGFPYVWDEITVGIGNDSDLAYAMEVIRTVAARVVGPAMEGPIEAYRDLLGREGLGFDVSDEPQIYLTPAESWTDLTVRYLVMARERRRWSSALHLEIAREIANPDHESRIVVSYPVQRVLVSGAS